jgi:hypothetical protein
MVTGVWPREEVKSGSDIREKRRRICCCKGGKKGRVEIKGKVTRDRGNPAITKTCLLAKGIAVCERCGMGRAQTATSYTFTG